MKKIFLLSLILFVGCSSKPTVNDSIQDEEAPLPKAAPARGHGETIYQSNTPDEVTTPPVQTKLEPKVGLSCDTPLGTIPDGGKATGFLQATVPEDEVCISDTLTCKDGKWSGEAIHPKCKVLREKTAR
ncbi:MAG: hypothetical protein HUU57_13875 [Bdellovibrio sp.]|nr:hypothetical protein [Bdellovibrio sp.]